MIGFNRVAAWIAIALVASLVLSGAFILAVSPEAQAETLPSAGQRLNDSLAQAEDQPDIEQVGEDEGGDAEALDEGGAAAPEDGDDVELLDQGAPPTEAAAPVDNTVPVAEADAVPLLDADTAQPSDGVAVYSAPAQPASTGPALPPGFGSGRVRVSAGRFGFPVGLESCHVGAVTGRAYVGINCEDGADVVGHARSFEDFPFVLEAEFPFESDDAFFSDPFFTGGEVRDDGEDADVEVTASRTVRSDTTENLVVTGIGTGNNSVELAQRGRDREPRARTGKSKPESQSERQKTARENVSAASEGDNDSKSSNRAKARGEEKHQVASKNKNKNKGKNKKSKDAKKKKDKRRSGKKD